MFPLTLFFVLALVLVLVLLVLVLVLLVLVLVLLMLVLVLVLVLLVLLVLVFVLVLVLVAELWTGFCTGDIVLVLLVLVLVAELWTGDIVLVAELWIGFCPDGIDGAVAEDAEFEKPASVVVTRSSAVRTVVPTGTGMDVMVMRCSSTMRQVAVAAPVRWAHDSLKY